MDYRDMKRKIAQNQRKAALKNSLPESPKPQFVPVKSEKIKEIKPIGPEAQKPEAQTLEIGPKGTTPEVAAREKQLRDHYIAFIQYLGKMLPFYYPTIFWVPKNNVKIPCMFPLGTFDKEQAEKENLIFSYKMKFIGAAKIKHCDEPVHFYLPDGEGELERWLGDLKEERERGGK